MNLTVRFLIGLLLVLIGSLSDMVKCDDVKITTIHSTESSLNTTHGGISPRNSSATPTATPSVTPSIHKKNLVNITTVSPPTQLPVSNHTKPKGKFQLSESTTPISADEKPTSTKSTKIRPGSFSNSIHKSDMLILTVHILSATAYFTSALLLF